LSAIREFLRTAAIAAARSGIAQAGENPFALVALTKFQVLVSVLFCKAEVAIARTSVVDIQEVPDLKQKFIPPRFGLEICWRRSQA